MPTVGETRYQAQTLSAFQSIARSLEKIAAALERPEGGDEDDPEGGTSTPAVH